MDYNGSGYAAISRELHDTGVGSSWKIFVPVGEGDLMADMIEGFEKLGEMPRFIGATIPGNAFSDVGKEDGNPADKLATRYSDFYKLLNEKCSQHGHEILTITAEEINEEMKVLDSLSIRSGPNAAVAFAAARKYSTEPGFDEGENIVILNT